MYAKTTYSVSLRRNLLVALLWITSSLFLVGSSNEPLNVMVKDLTFSRPADWKWLPPPPDSTAEVCFVVRFQNESPITDVRFHISSKGLEVEEKTWKGWFVEINEKATSVQRVKIGSREVFYVTVQGTYTNGKFKDKPGYALLGAVIPVKKEFVHVRLLGPRTDVERATPEFKQMIHDALQE